MAEHITVERTAATAVVTVNRPDKLNALNAGIVDELHQTFRVLAGDEDIRGVILTGAGAKAFVAGADIGELAKMSPLSGIGVSRAGQDAFRFIETMAKPVVAAVNGFALGGGLELALACHIR
ncbi:MAG TPA: enoyl-CoA hydratase-related protein, partial [Longimicrobiales bacterium]|nr:enoyl-CoA hydratase-related protein [Longimicrobiales bacterium]